MITVNEIKQRFLTLNRDRLNRTWEVLRPRQRDILDVLPLLFHVNHPNFPGFISKNTPTGVSDYAPSNRTLDAAKRLVRSFDYKRRALPSYQIHSMFLMGSSGTIAYSATSDFDIWLCHDPRLSAAQLAELQQKATEIEKWADTLDLEVHFFLMNADNFREGKGVELSSESSGSAQHHLLLEEFYRTSLLIAGRYPIWWLVPPEEEGNYRQYVDRLITQRFIKDSEAIDFGGLPRAPAEEFFGAAVWQLYKGIDSPYKAALKLILMEVYAHEYPDVDLLSRRFKRAVYAGEKEIAALDPYIMLYNKIEEYLLARDDANRLALMQRCFYFKVNEQLGKPDNPRYTSWRREKMRELTTAWQWDIGFLQLLDSRPNWKIQRVIDERKVLVSALTQSYHSLSDFARKNSLLATINQRDLTILGRKLYAAFERKAGKIDIINKGISDDVRESHLTIHQIGAEQNTGWVMYQDIVAPEDVEYAKPLKRARGLIELIAWAFLNQMIDDRTAIALYANDQTITLNGVKAVIRYFSQMFPNAVLPVADFDSLAQAPAIRSIALLVNIGTESLPEREREGKYLTSNKSDALSYGGICENQVRSIDQIILTTWSEVMTFRFEGEAGLFECLNTYMSWAPPSQHQPPAAVSADCFSSTQNVTVARRVEELFNDVCAAFYNRRHAEQSRYVLVVGRHFYLLRLVEDKLEHKQIGSEQDLLQELAAPQSSFSPVVVDRYALNNSILPEIFAINKPGVIQLFYYSEQNAIHVYIVDENGSLFYKKGPAVDMHMLIAQYKRFLDNVGYRRNLHRRADESAARPTEMEFYHAILRRGDSPEIVQYELAKGADNGRYFNLQVIGNVSEGGQPVFSIFCNDQEFSSLEFGDRVFFETAMHVLEKRRGGQRYPIYITDIDMSSEIVGIDSSDRMQTIHYLTYKKNIEEKLNAALAAIVDRLAANQGR